MRKIQQKKILELLQTIEQAQAASLYADCQEGAISIGEFIESFENEGSQTVTLLEEYCELLFRASKGEVTQKQLLKHLIRVENSVKTVLKPNRLEVAFFPYKAAMWDSLESIYLAARDDPQCDAYVIPIPYFDRKPDGSFEQMHYEGGDYPVGIPITDWREYDVEARHPDIIFIHSPYDDGNYVTSIHPDYYSKRLKDLTDLLVYVPYFVCADNVAPHFCTCAGVLYADKIIVESEKVRQTYIEEFRIFEQKNNCKGMFGNPNTKIAALGSPKFDKVLSTRLQDQHIPDEWMELIKRPDGTHKKIILYNTSINGLLSANEKALLKLRYVFDCFKGRDDVVLLWRPHPLNEATYRSMRPQLYDAYMSIVDEYRQQGTGACDDNSGKDGVKPLPLGIYDDSSDMHRAIALSDAYYGDSSSVAVLYKVTEKPMVIQHAEVYEKPFYRLPGYLSILFADEKYLLLQDYDTGGLMMFDKMSQTVKYVGRFEDIDPRVVSPYINAIRIGSKWYFTPYRGGYSILVYDSVSASTEYIRLEERKTCHVPEAAIEWTEMFRWSYLIDGCIFFVPASYPAIVRLNPLTGELDYFDDFMKPVLEFCEKTGSDNPMYLFRRCVLIGRKIAFICARANVLIEFDTCALQSKVTDLGGGTKGNTALCFDGENYWTAPWQSGCIIKYNTRSGEITHIEADPLVAWSDYLVGMFYRKGFVYAVFQNLTTPKRINIMTNEVTAADEFDMPSQRGWSYTSHADFADMVVQHAGDGVVIEMNKHNDEITRTTITGMDMILEECRLGYARHLSRVFRENPKNLIIYEWDLSLDVFLSALSNDEAQSKQASSKYALEAEAETVNLCDGKSGQAIYNYVKGTALQ